LTEKNYYEPVNTAPMIRPYTATLTQAQPSYTTTKDNNGLDFRLAAVYLVNRDGAGARRNGTFTLTVERLSGLSAHHDLFILSQNIVAQSDLSYQWEAGKNKYLDWTYRRTTPKVSPLPPSPYQIGPFATNMRVWIEGGLIVSLTVAGTPNDDKEGSWLLPAGQTIGMLYAVPPDVWIWPPGITEGGTGRSDQIRVSAVGLQAADNLHVEILLEDA